MSNREEGKEVASLVAQMTESSCNAGDLGLVPGWGRAPGEGHGNPLQYSCLVNSMDRGAWRAAVHGVTKESNTTKQLNHHQAEKWQFQSSNIEARS